ncbi:hypothetical protein [Alkalitalea saponilacus]|uniref:Uncharacterized protein n=1 Tax=Alkalitalea saponilacus TaxID=889453 RepID=A0A1T5HA72_9BACT|nr:hypothetical protein [Alkalitalea saponilacus]SKC17572.1 hypothetical protein SAMN03080601_02177 [Alkalitalea saponilacus]
MNKKHLIFFVFILSMLLMPTGINSQKEDLVKECMTDIRPPFIVGDRSMKAFLTGEEVAEFRTTLFDGNTYRIILCTFEEKLMEFSIYDTNRNLLFNSSEYGYAGMWDFQMEGSMECIIEARLNNEIAQSGMAMLLIGFKHSRE